MKYLSVFDIDERQCSAKQIAKILGNIEEIPEDYSGEGGNILADMVARLYEIGRPATIGELFARAKDVAISSDHVSSVFEANMIEYLDSPFAKTIFARLLLHESRPMAGIVNVVTPQVEGYPTLSAIDRIQVAPDEDLFLGLNCLIVELMETAAVAERHYFTVGDSRIQELPSPKKAAFEGTLNRARILDTSLLSSAYHFRVPQKDLMNACPFLIKDAHDEVTYYRLKEANPSGEVYFEMDYYVMSPENLPQYSFDDTVPEA